MFEELVAKKIAEQTTLEEEQVLELIEIPPDESLGDYAFPCFVLAKELKKAPLIIAQELAEKITDELFVKVEAKGPYINFFIKPGAWTRQLSSFTQRLWSPFLDEKVLLEYPSPNTNKPLHLGHVRNMVLGSTVYKVLSRAGAQVVQVNLNNDRGVHICKSMLAYKLWGSNQEPDKKSDHFVGDWYVRFAKEAEQDPSLNEQAQEMLQRWEEGDEEVLTLWKKMNSWAYTGWQETFKEFSVSFDKEYYESDIYSEGKKLVLDNKSLFEVDDGAVVADLDDYKLPKKVLLRRDGTSIYITQDLALTLKKEEEFSPDKQVWIVGNEQELHFRQLFAILDLLGYPKKNYFHLSYGMIELPSGKMKSREGSVVDADDLLSEVKVLAEKNIRERQEWPEKKVQAVAHSVALAAIRFFIIKYDPVKGFVFHPEKSLSFEGDTGPYLQYTHARISRILEKAGYQHQETTIELGVEEVVVCKAVSGLRQAFVEAASNYKPHLIAQQLLVLGRAINSYYHSTPVLQAEQDVQDMRLMFLYEVRAVLAQGLSLLGIDAPKEM